MEKNPALKTESAVERFSERIGKITLYRHGDTHYTNQYPDLTDRGKWRFVRAGRHLKEMVDEGTEDLLFLHSPSVRAKSSMAFLLRGMGRTMGTFEQDVEQHAHALKPLRSVHINNPEGFAELIGKHIDQESPIEAQHRRFDRIYMMHNDYETSPHIEPRSRVQSRGRRMMRQAVYLLVKNHTEKTTDKTPHIVAISHVETLNDIAFRIFGLDVQKDPLYARGERMTVEVKTDSQTTDKVLLLCEFRGTTKPVWFDLASGEISSAE